jgi:hypothetical protein
MNHFLRAALLGAALLLPGCAAEQADANAVTVYKSPT